MYPSRRDIALANLEFLSIIARMIKRRLQARLRYLLGEFPAVVLLGPRQVGKTTLAHQIADGLDSVYLDLETPSQLAKLADAELYLADHKERLVILDEVHRAPDLFRILRGNIDQGRREGRRSGRFLLLGSASMDLLRQSGESLAGRIAYLELNPFDALEVETALQDRLWIRGGFPDSFLARSEELSFEWRENFIRAYLERDVPQLGPRIPAETLRRFWVMLAHSQGSPLNAAMIARSLGVDGKTVAGYLDLMVDLLLVRRLRPWHANVGKRLRKSPKVYVRDSGMLHALLNLRTKEDVLGHPVAGHGWEGFVIENLLSVAPARSEANYYRAAGGAEIDLVLTLPGRKPWAIAVKRRLGPKLTRGFYNACEEVNPEARFVVYPGAERYPVSRGVEAISLSQLLGEIMNRAGAGVEQASGHEPEA